MKCLICDLDLDDYDSCQVQFETIQKLIERSRTVRNDNLAEALKGIKTIRLHNACRNKYNSPRYDTFKKITPYNITRAELDEMERLENITHDQVRFEYVPMIRKHCFKGDNSLNKTLPKFHGTCIIKTLKNEPDKVKNNQVKQENDPLNAKANFENIDKSTPPDKQMPVDKAISTVHEHEPVIEREPYIPFPFQSKCFVCTEDLCDKEKHPRQFKRKSHHLVIKEQTQENIIKYLTNAASPEHLNILQRIQGVNLVEARASYHKICIQRVWSANRPRKGRGELCNAMERIIRYIDASAHTEFTVQELMSDTIHGDEYMPSRRTVRNNLERHYAGKYYYTRGVVTILKDSVSGVSRLSQPWNLNGTELGGLLEDYHANRKPCRPAIKTRTEKKQIKKTHKKKQNEDAKKCENETQGEENLKDSDVQTKRKTRSQAKQKLARKVVDKVAINKGLDEDAKITIEIKEENHGDFIDDTFYSDDDGARYIERNELFCRICFSSDRKLNDLGKYRNVFQKLCSDIMIQDIESKLFLICWECRALLRNVEHFQEKIRIAQQSWKTEICTKLEILSSLCLTSPDIFSNTVEEQSTEQIGVDCKEMFEPEVVLVDTDYPSTLDEKNTIEEEKHYEGATENYTELSSEDKKEESNIENDTFDKQPKGLYTSEQEDYQEYENNHDNDTFGEQTGDFNTDEGDDVEDNQDGDNIKDSSGDDDTDDTEIDKTSKKQIKKTKKKPAKRRESEDPDWGTEVKNKGATKKPKIVPKVVKTVKIPYTFIVQTFLTETKMKREPMEPHELQHWLDTERNSEHFKSSKRKCMKCASEVPDNHNQLCHSQEYPYVCKICESTFPSEYEVASHEAKHYYIFSCEFCPYKCYNETHMRNHVETHRRLVQCLQCFAAFESFEILSDHFNSLHHHAECDICGKQFLNKHSILRHLKSNHTLHKCTMCAAVYMSRFRLKKHVSFKHRIERTEAAYCVQCDIQFDNELQFKRHLRVSTKHSHERDKSKIMKKPIKCPECPKIYSGNYNMKRHYNLVHETAKKFYCKICNKAFAGNFQLVQHMKIKHEGYQLHKNKFCQFCGRGFSTNHVLRNHIRTHTGERPFACAHCPSSFAQKVALQSHIAHIHEKQQRTTVTKPSTSTKPQKPPSFFD